MNFLDLPDLFRDRVVAFCDAQTIVNLRYRSETGSENRTGSSNQKFEPVFKVDRATIFTIIFQKKLSGQESLKKNSVEIGRKGLAIMKLYGKTHQTVSFGHWLSHIRVQHLVLGSTTLECNTWSRVELH